MGAPGPLEAPQAWPTAWEQDSPSRWLLALLRATRRVVGQPPAPLPRILGGWGPVLMIQPQPRAT